MVIRSKQYRSYRCQRNHFRFDRLSDVSGNLSQGMESLYPVVGRFPVIRWRSFYAFYVHAGNKLVRAFFRLSIRCARCLVDEKKEDVTNIRRVWIERYSGHSSMQQCHPLPSFQQGPLRLHIRLPARRQTCIQ